MSTIHEQDLPRMQNTLRKLAVHRRAVAESADF
jgi:hypothetical protein